MWIVLLLWFVAFLIGSVVLVGAIMFWNFSTFMIWIEKKRKKESTELDGEKRIKADKAKTT